MKHIALCLMFVSAAAIAAVHNPDGSVLLDAEEVERTIAIFNSMNERLALDELKIRELTEQLTLLKNSKCM